MLYNKKRTIKFVSGIWTIDGSCFNKLCIKCIKTFFLHNIHCMYLRTELNCQILRISYFNMAVLIETCFFGSIRFWTSLPVTNAARDHVRRIFTELRENLRRVAVSVPL